MANPTSYFLLFKFFIHTSKGTGNQNAFDFIGNVGNEWLCPRYSLSLKCLLPPPSASSEISISLRQSKLGVAKWIPNPHPHIPPEGNLHLTQTHTLLLWNPGASRKLPPRPQKPGLNKDHDWFRSPGPGDQSTTPTWSRERAVQARQHSPKYLRSCWQGSFSPLRDTNWTRRPPSSARCCGRVRNHCCQPAPKAMMAFSYVWRPPHCWTCS